MQWFDYSDEIAFGIELFKPSEKFLWIIIDFFIIHFCLQIQDELPYKQIFQKKKDWLAFSVSVILKEKYISLHFLKWRWSNFKEGGTK